MHADAILRHAPSGDPPVETLPLSSAQQRVWLLDQLEPGRPARIVRAFRLKGRLDRAALEASLNTIVERHRILRATYDAADGAPLQRFAPSARVELRIADLTRTGADREREALAALEREVDRAWDLSADPMLRAVLVKLAPQDHALALAVHRIAADEISARVLLRELAALYGAYSTGRPSPLESPPAQYADFALSQRSCGKDEVLAGHVSYWKEKLADAAPLPLPTDRPRPAAQAFHVSRAALDALKNLLPALENLSRAEGASLSVILQAAFAVLLYRYSGQEDPVIGATVSGRDAPAEGAIGPFVDHLPLRMNLSGEPSFREALARAIEAGAEAWEHRALRFEKLLEELQPERDATRHPLFQAAFDFSDAPAEAFAPAGLAANRIELDGETSDFDLTLSVAHGNDSIAASFAYNTALFDAATVRRMAGHFATMLEAIAADPSRRISDLPLLTGAERHRLLVEWNDTKRGTPEDKPVHRLFELQADRSPGAPAVVFENSELTYRELNQRANRLARHLRARGVGPGVLVGISVERSQDAAVGLLGILKAGGAYLPLDPAYPDERLAFMVQDAGVSLVLTQARSGAIFAASGVEKFRLDADWPALAAESAENLPPLGNGEDLAYVIYTSGSTGKPKGVQITHRALAIHGAACVERYALGPSDRVLQFASLSFDVSAEELFPPWIAGAAVVLLPRQTLAIPDFLEFLERQRLTVVNLPAPYWHEWVLELSHASENFPRALRLVIVGNEKVSPQRFAEWRQAVGDRGRWMNAYGPTEATITATVYEPAPESAARDAVSVAIGRPLAGKQVYILDRRLEPAPIGVPGELHIGGATLARGYLNRPALTAEKFIADPFAPGGRLYKTGDLARYRADGNIEFLGRVDDQVKLRGFRIEPGEIEAVLAQHPAVRAAVVTVREDAPGDQRLAAYVVAAEKDGAAADLRSYLKGKLPDYMVPSAFVFMESLPLTPSGKIDRRALPVPATTGAGRPDYAPPSHSLERQLVAIWEDYLGVRPIGVRDNFFELGGNSLIAARVMVGIEKACGRKIPLSTLFDGATIEYLGKKILEQRPAGGDSLLVKVQPRGAKRPLFFLHGDFYGGGFYCLNLARALDAERPFYALNTQGVNGGAMPASIEAMAEAYIELVRSAQPRGPYVFAGFCNGGVIAYEMARQLAEKGEQVDLVMMIAADMFNTRLLALHRLIRAAGALLGLDAEKRADLFAVWRERVIRVALRLKKVLGRGSGTPGDFVAAEAGIEGYDPHVEQAYCRVLDRYVPQPYRGRLVLFWPVDERGELRRDPSGGWAKVAPQIDVRMIPGGHISSIFEHARGLAERMQACLDEAESPAAKASSSTPVSEECPS